MKNKTLQKVLCFCLALCFCFSIAIKPVQAHAAATEAWMVYALISYLAGMGITFTVAGGVDAMVQAMEEKVKDYEQANNIIDFYESMRNRNVRLVPNNNQDPDGNPFFDLFFTSSAVEAIQAFVNWLTSEGGLTLNGSYQDTLTLKTFTGFVNGQETLLYSCQGVSGENMDYVNAVLDVEEVGSLIPVDFSIYYPLSKNLFYFINSVDYSSYLSGPYTGPTNWYRNAQITFYAEGGYSGYWSQDIGTFMLNNGYGDNWYQSVEGLTFYIVDGPFSPIIRPCFYMSDGKLVQLYNQMKYYPKDLIDLSSYVDIITPDELQEQFPSVDQGVSIADAISFPMGDPSLIEWGNRMEETFIETGTIPQPQPEVIADPDYAPAPTPVPTPVPSPEIEDIDDLGLPTLGNAIINKFPFSLPKDLKRIAVILNAEPVTPFWEVNLYETLGNRVPFVGDTTIRIDLAEYEALGQISRWASVITFVIFLVIITKGVIRW